MKISNKKQQMRKGKENKKRAIRLFMMISILSLSFIFQYQQEKAAVNEQQTDTNKVAVDDTVAIADAKKYKDMDATFLKTMHYATSLETDTEFSDVRSMKSVKLVIKPDLVSGLKVKQEGNALTLNWEQMQDATGYFVYRYNDRKNTWDLLTKVKE